MTNKHRNPGLALLLALFLLLGSMGCNAAQAASPTYVTVTPASNETEAALNGLSLPNANSLPATATIPVIAMARILTPPATPNVDYLATSIAGATATVVKAIELNNYQTGGEKKNGSGGSASPTGAPTRQPAGASTPTPTRQPTGAPSPTNTPTPPSGSAAFVRIQDAQFTGCANNLTTDLTVSGANNLQGFAFKLRFNPAIVQVVDADPGQDGTQIKLGSAFSGGQNFIAVNTVDQNTGLIDFAAVMIGGQSVNGEAVLAQIEWTPRQSGNSALRLENVELATSGGASQPAQTQNGTIENLQTCN